MGHPKRQRKKYEKPKKPFDKARIEEEKALMKEFGLRKKKELWKAEGIIRNFRRRARKAQATKNKDEEHLIISKLINMGLLQKGAKLDDVLELSTRDILERRLQTIVYKNKLATTIKQARQFITHGHILIRGRKIRWPSALISLHEEKDVKLSPTIEKNIKGDKND